MNLPITAKEYTDSRGCTTLVPEHHLPPWAPVDTNTWEGGSILSNCIAECGGIMAYYDILPFPRGCYELILSQLQRFNLPPAPAEELEPFWCFALHYIDLYEPLMFFGGLTDVILTEDRYYYTFARYQNASPVLSAQKPKVTVHLNPEEFETYRLWEPGAQNYEYMMRHPGMRGIHEFEDMFWNFWEDQVDIDEQFRDSIKYFGPHFEDVAHLTIWACTVWMLSPLPDARAWRQYNHPIFEAVYQFGECLVEWGSIYGPDEYEKLEIPAQTCVACHTRLWCADPIDVPSGDTLFMCDHCDPRPPEASRCKHCQNTQCPHMQNKLVMQPHRGAILHKIVQDHGLELPGKLQQALIVGGSRAGLDILGIRG